MIFDIITNQRPSVEAIEKVLAALYPGIKSYPAAFVPDSPLHKDENETHTLFDVTTTVDSQDWPYLVEFNFYYTGISEDDYPAIRIAAALSDACDCNCLCDVENLVSHLNPSDPYWWLAFVNKQWYLADSSGTRLMETEVIEPKESIQYTPLTLLYPLELSKPKKHLYDYHFLAQASR